MPIRIAHPHVTSAIITLNDKPSHSYWGVTMGFVFSKRSKNHFKILLKMFTVLAGTVQDKNVSMLLWGGRMVRAVTNVCIAKRAVTFWKFLLEAKSQQLYCLAVMGHIVLPRKWVKTTKNKNHVSFGEIFPPIAISITQTGVLKGTNQSVSSKSCRLPICWCNSPKIHLDFYSRPFQFFSL